MSLIRMTSAQAWLSYLDGRVVDTRPIRRDGRSFAYLVHSRNARWTLRRTPDEEVAYGRWESRHHQ